MKKTLIPNDFGDFLSLISLFGFIAIFFEFVFQYNYLSNLLTSIFLIFGGAGLMIVGKVFSIRKWLRNGIQQNEWSMLFSIIFGLTGVIIGVLLSFNIILPLQIQGYIGFLALPPAIYILFDYWIKNMINY